MKKLLLILMVAFCYNTVSAQVTAVQQWVQYYNGPDSLNDASSSIDVNGNVYVSGASQVPPYTPLIYKITTIKYSPSGVQQWIATYDSISNASFKSIAMKVDASSNVYVTGSVINNQFNPTTDIIVLKYDSTGTLLWASMYAYPYGKSDEPKAIALDQSGNVYVTGFVSDSSTVSYTGISKEFVTLKFNSAGIQQWVKHYSDNAKLDDIANDISVDNSGNVYVTGFSWNSISSRDIVTIKYNSNGVQQWLKKYDGGNDDFANKLALDNLNNIYVTGSSKYLTSEDYITIKYDNSGAQQWIAFYNGTGNSTDIAKDIAIDNNGQIIVTGSSTSSVTGLDYATVKYDSNGNQLWVATYNGTGNGADDASSLSLDVLGNIYITGQSAGISTGIDYATVKYAISGIEQWAIRFDGVAHSSDIATDIKVTSIGEVYVTGYSYNGTDYDFATVKYIQMAAPACATAIQLTTGNSCLTQETLTGTEKWYYFIPDSSSVEIVVTNLTPNTGHIHNIILSTGICYVRLYPIASNSIEPNDTTITIKINDLIVGTPHYIELMRAQPDCPKCINGSAIYNLCVYNIPKPIETDSNGVVFLDGKPSHMKNQVILRINKIYLKMNAVNNTSQVDKTMPVFVEPQLIQKMAHQIYNGDVIGLGKLHLTKVFPDMTSADSISISRLGETIRIPNFWETFILTIPDTISVFKTSRELNITNGIRYAEPNYVSTFTDVPDDNYYAFFQASLHPTITYPNANINVEGAWDIETGKSFIKIGVYDTGIDQTHDELNGGKVGGGYNFYAGTGLSSPYDNIGHGTSVAGIIGAYRNNTTGISGIAGGNGLLSNPGCTLYDMRIATTSFAIDTKIADAIRKGATSSGAGGFELHIMSNSWGGGVFSNAIHDAVQFAVRNGVIFIASRGNYPQTTPIDANNYPATLQDEMVINVGASGTDGEWKTTTNGNIGDQNDMDYSSLTKHNVDIIAPGTNAVVYTTENATNDYHGFNGTSSACPHVSGVAGLMLSHVDQASPISTNLVIEDVENILQISAVDKIYPPASLGYDVYSGWGLVDATATMNKIKLPAYKIQHFGLAQNVTSSSISYSLISSNTSLVLQNNYQGLAAGIYYGDKYSVDITLNYNLSSPTDQIINSWPRFSSTIGWSLANPMNYDNWCQIISVTNHKAVLRTYIYNFLHDANGNNITDPWFPTTIQSAKAALSIYTYDPALSVNEIADAGLSFSAFPNPAINSSIVSISLPHSQEISLELFDAQGKLVKLITNEKVSEGTHQYNVSLLNISEGVYFYKLVTENASYSKKLVVIK